MRDLLPFLIAGSVIGSMYAIVGMGLVLTYRTSGIFNFAHGAVGMFCTYLYFKMIEVWGIPKVAAAVLTLLVIAPAIGMTLDRLLFRPLLGAPMVTKIIVTVGLFVTLLGLVVKIFGPEGRRVEGLFPTRVLHLGPANVSIDQLGIVASTLVAAAALAFLLRSTRLGTAMLATVDNRTLAGTAGVDTNLVSGLAWAMSSSMAALAGILLSPLTVLDPYILSLLVIQAYSAAMLGALQSLPLTLVGGFSLGIIESLVVRWAPSGGVWTGLKPTISFFALLVLLVVHRASALAAPVGETLVPRQLRIPRRVVLSRPIKIAGGVVLGAAVLLVPLAASPSWRFSLATIPVLTLLYLSLVLVTGLSGQISLCQGAFMGIGAFTAANLVSESGWPFWPAVALASIVAMLAGIAVAIPAVRLRGLFLALLTLGVGLLFDNLLFKAVSFAGGAFGVRMPRPGLGHTDLSFYYLAGAIAVAAAVALTNLRRGRVGRVLSAMRQSEVALRTLGVSVARYRLLAFSLSAALAGLSGALFASLQSSVGAQSFPMFQSLFFLTVAVVGGINSVGGAILAAALAVAVPRLASYSSALQGLPVIFFGLGPTLFLARQPEGLWGYLRALVARLGGSRADAAARWAETHEIAVPALAGVSRPDRAAEAELV